jgi:hypothetical protein
MPVTVGDPDEVQLGAGVLYVATLATPDPVSAAAVAAGSATREVGWTDDGSTISFETTSEKIFVEEEFNPVKTAVTQVVSTVAFAMSQSTRQNLALALNLGADAANDATMLEPGVPGEELRVKLFHVSDAGALWIFRRCFQTGSIVLNNQKAPDYKKIPVTFDLEVPGAGVKPWACIPTADGLI